jgi:Tfp pilus assembly protein PilV
MKTIQPPTPKKQQKGSVLIEALLAALIFALAAIGAMGMIANSSQSAGEIRARMEAAALAEDILGRMQADMGTAVTNLNAYDDSNVSDPPASKTQWQNNIAATLPNSSGTITVTTYAGGIATEITIQIRWTMAGSASRVHTLTTALAPNQ